MSVKPKKQNLRIGITYDFDDRLGYFLKADLVRAFRRPALDLVPFFYDKAELAKLDSLDGFLIPGGLSDLDPKTYRQKKRHPSVKILKSRAEFEFRILDQFLPTEKPVLAICWGMQMTNVYFGGSLHQHLPVDWPSNIQHEQKEPGHKATHWVKKSSRVKLFGADKLFVNSTHHQGIDRLASDLTMRGIAEDGLTEAFQWEPHPFLWAVQWHPERLRGDPVIPTFLKACRRRD
jgi:putative glutamine amidotransferase